MKAVAIVDTSILLNIVPVPGDDQDHDAVVQELEHLILADTSLLLPLAAVFETGSHIADMRTGNRYDTAERFVALVHSAIAGTTPFTPMQTPALEQVASWLQEFPRHASQQHSLADLSMIKEWERQAAIHQGRRVFIWSLDDHLRGHDRPPLI